MFRLQIQSEVLNAETLTCCFFCIVLFCFLVLWGQFSPQPRGYLKPLVIDAFDPSHLINSGSVLAPSRNCAVMKTSFYESESS